MFAVSEIHTAIGAAPNVLQTLTRWTFTHSHFQVKKVAWSKYANILFHERIVTPDPDVCNVIQYEM